MAPGRKRLLKPARGDDDEEALNLDVVQGRAVFLSKDGKRHGASATATCARIDNGIGQPLIWTNRFHVPDTPKVAHRRKDRNMARWVDLGRPQLFLDEFIKLEARPSSICSSCHDGLRDTAAAEGIYQCETCFGMFVECEGCTIASHRRNPFHVLRKWNGLFFEPGATLRELGLRIQFGHQDINYCVNPQPAHSDFTIMHGTGIHKLNVDFCGCAQRAPTWLQMLRSEVFPATTMLPKTGATFRYLEQVEMTLATGKMSIFAAYQALEKLTDNTRTRLPKSRYKALSRMNRQFGHIKMLKRAGRGCYRDGRASTLPGDLALHCPACPRPGVNLPANWESYAPDEQYLFRVILALDANFRLKNLRRPSTDDPGLQTGWAYFVEEQPYLKHLAKYPRQKDISSCAGFKTLAHAETKNSLGLRSTGIGICCDARHEFVLANAIADLQRGERYCNMDYIFLSALRNTKLRAAFLSYDIVCQWFVNFKQRLEAMPDCLHLPDDLTLAFGVPKCHCKGHKIECQVEFSMNVQDGVGRTCGEGIERIWSGLNNVAPSTKEMLPGARHDALDRQVGHHNWDKMVDLARSLHRKAYHAEVGRAQHVEAHEEFTDHLPEDCEGPWTERVVKWEADHTLPNPYFLVMKHATEHSIRQALEEEERREAADTPPLHDSSPSVCLALGLVIEEDQRRIVRQLGSEDCEAPAVVKDIQDRRKQVQQQLRQFRTLQAVYMPIVVARLKELSGSRDGDVEDEKLFLPSSFASVQRARPDAFLGGIVSKEETLREAQCFDALETIRRLQRARVNVRSFRKRNLRGQGPVTKSLGVLVRLEEKVAVAVEKYCAARNALLALRGAGDWERTLREMGQNDVRTLNSFVFDTDEPAIKRRKTGMKENDVQYGSGSYYTSWIYRIENAHVNTPELHHSVRVEWLKSRARARSWTQETRLLDMEKKRTLISFNASADTWISRASGWEGIEPGLAAGLHAHCHRQADVYHRLARHCVEVWDTPFKPGRRRVRDRIEMETIPEEDEEDEEQEEEDMLELEEARAAAQDDADPTLDPE